MQGLLDKLTQTMTRYYRDEANQKYHQTTSVSTGDLVACRFTSEDSFYRAKVVAFKVGITRFWSLFNNICPNILLSAIN